MRKPPSTSRLLTCLLPLAARYNDIVSKVLPFVARRGLPKHVGDRTNLGPEFPNALNRPAADLIVSAAVTGNETGAPVEEGAEVLEEDRLWMKRSNEVLRRSAAHSRHLSPSKGPRTFTLPDVRTAVLAGQK